VKRLADGLISPTLFFIKRLQDEEVQANGGTLLGSGGALSSHKKGDVIGGKVPVFKPRKIKENHMVMMLNLARKCLEDGEVSLAEAILNTQISMQVISEDLMQLNQHKAKGFSKDFIQRYLSGIAEFIKTE